MTTPSSSDRLVGLLLMISGALLGLGLLLKLGVGIYSWYTSGPLSNSFALLSVNLLALLASGLLMRWGLRLRRGGSMFRNPNTDGIL